MQFVPAVNRFNYINKSATQNNPILFVIYVACLPVVRAAKFLRLSPNLITGASLVTGLASVPALASQELGIFYSLWTVSFVLDFVDGTLARMTGNLSSFPLDIDHFSDLVKINLVFVGFGLYFQDGTVWLMTSLAAFGFMFYTLLNHEISVVLAARGADSQGGSQSLQNKFTGKSGGAKRRAKEALARSPLGLRLAVVAKTTLFSIHAHTFLLFFLIPVSWEAAVLSLSYILFLSVFNVFEQLSRLR